MTIREVLKESREKLIKNNTEAPGLVSGVLLSFVLKCDRTYLLSHGGQEITREKYDIFQGYIDRVISGEPVSYILGYKEFMSFRFEVGKGVLIPRPETELLVEEVINAVTSCDSFREKPVNILDVCSGSGCIAISLAKILQKKGYNCNITGVDVSDTALDFSVKNARLNGVEDRVHFYRQDIFHAGEKYFTSLISGSLYDIVVSNPPYIPRGDIQSLDTCVRDFEPHIALDGGTDGLDFYREITGIASRILKKNGMLFYEAGINQAEHIKAIMEGYFSNIKVKKDFSGIDRIVFGMLY